MHLLDRVGHSEPHQQPNIILQRQPHQNPRSSPKISFLRIIQTVTGHATERRSVEGRTPTPDARPTIVQRTQLQTERLQLVVISDRPRNHETFREATEKQSDSNIVDKLSCFQVKKRRLRFILLAKVKVLVGLADAPVVLQALEAGQL